MAFVRTALLDILHERLNQTSHQSISLETFLFIAKQFESSADLILLTKDVEWNGSLVSCQQQLGRFLFGLCLY